MSKQDAIRQVYRLENNDTQRTIVKCILYGIVSDKDDMTELISVLNNR